MKTRRAGKQGEAGLLVAGQWGEKNGQESCWVLFSGQEVNLITVLAERSAQKRQPIQVNMESKQMGQIMSYRSEREMVCFGCLSAKMQKSSGVGSEDRSTGQLSSRALERQGLIFQNDEHPLVRAFNVCSVFTFYPITKISLFLMVKRQHFPGSSSSLEIPNKENLDTLRDYFCSHYNKNDFL